MEKIKKEKKIKKETKLVEVLNSERNRSILKEFNFPCLDCPMLVLEAGEIKIEEVCDKYKIDLKKILEKLNEGR